jgi:hypothetical protein
MADSSANPLEVIFLPPDHSQLGLSCGVSIAKEMKKAMDDQAYHFMLEGDTVSTSLHASSVQIDIHLTLQSCSFVQAKGEDICRVIVCQELPVQLPTLSIVDKNNV